MLTVLRCDESPLVRSHLAQSLLTSLVAVSVTDVLGPALARTVSTADNLAFEEYGENEVITTGTSRSRGGGRGGSGAAGSDEGAAGVERTIRTLRKELGDRAALHEGLLACIQSPSVDRGVRLTALKLAEILVKPAPEPLPKLKFRLPAASASGETGAPFFKAASRRSSENGTRLIREDSPDVPLVQSIVVKQPQALKRKPKKVAKALDAQRSGMTIEDVRGCESILNKLVNTRLAELFRYPVDPIKDNVPECVEHH